MGQRLPPDGKTKKDGLFSITLELKKNKEYQFRYLLGGQCWINDAEADKFYIPLFEDIGNSIIVV